MPHAPREEYTLRPTRIAGTRFDLHGWREAMPSLAVVGGGKWGFNWVRTLAKLPGIHFKTCCDISEARLKSIQQQFPGVGVTTRYEDLLQPRWKRRMVLDHNEDPGSRICFI